MQRGKALIRVFNSFKTLTRLKKAQSFCLSHSLQYRHVSISSTVMAYNTVERGCLNTMDYRVFITNSEGVAVSPFHDIPLVADEAKNLYNMVVEIPRWTNHKMEICKEEVLNPIKQDVKKGKVRFVKNCFPHHGYIWNYGALPQTWEDVTHTEPTTGTKGDNDPLDVCEIGQKVHARGSIIQVKILGVMCLVDEGETDWKVICIDNSDPMAEELNDIDDVDKVMPGFIKATREWFTVYKIPDGKPANKFAYNGDAKNKEFAMNVIKECNEQWKQLVGSGEATRGDIACQNLNVAGSPYKIDSVQSKEVVGKSADVGAAGELPSDVDKWHYIPSSAL